MTSSSRVTLRRGAFRARLRAHTPSADRTSPSPLRKSLGLRPTKRSRMRCGNSSRGCRMTNRITLPILIGFTLLLAGCVPSVSPLYTAKDLVYDPALVGVWAKDEKDATTWKFEKGDESSYKLVVVEGENSSPFVAHLVQLGEHRFMDLCPDKSGIEELKQADLYKAGLIRGHLFLKVLQIKPVLQMKMMDEDWLGKSGKEA